MQSDHQSSDRGAQPSVNRLRNRAQGCPAASRFAVASRFGSANLIAAIVIGLTLVIAAPANADTSADKKPYDKQLLRLSELLGAVHYLRELCGANEGMLWRKQMEDLIKAEGTSALRRLQFTRKFNFGYHSYSRTYHRCTPSAKTAINRFLNEAGIISATMVQNIK